jgi:hypothetical protein
MESLKVVHTFLKEINEIKEITKGTPLGKTKRKKLNFQTLDADDVDVKAWFPKTVRDNVLVLTFRFRMDLFMGVAEPETAKETLALLHILRGKWKGPYDEALKEAGLTSSLRPRAAQKRPADAGSSGQEAQEPVQKRAKVTAATEEMPTMMQELFDDKIFKDGLKVFKKDGLPQFIKTKASTLTEDSNPSELEAIKTQAIEFSRTLESKVKMYKENDWPETQVKMLLEGVWSLVETEMWRDPSLEQLDIMFKWMNDRLKSWDAPTKYLMTKADKNKNKKRRVTAGWVLGGGAPTRATPIVLDGSVEVIDA